LVAERDDDVAQLRDRFLCGRRNRDLGPLLLCRDRGYELLLVGEDDFLLVAKITKEGGAWSIWAVEDEPPPAGPT
jgi:hypothetical protein